MRACVQFKEEYNPSEVDSYQAHVEADGIRAKVDILDTSGQEDYAAARDSYIRSCMVSPDDHCCACDNLLRTVCCLSVPDYALLLLEILFGFSVVIFLYSSSLVAIKLPYCNWRALQWQSCLLWQLRQLTAV